MKYQLFSKNLHCFFHLEVLNFREILFNCLKNEKMLHSLKNFCSQPLKLGSEYDLKMIWKCQIRSDQIRSFFQNAIWSKIIFWPNDLEKGKVIWPYSGFLFFYLYEIFWFNDFFFSFLAHSADKESNLHKTMENLTNLMEHQQLQYEADGSNAEPTNANYGGFSQQVSFDFDGTIRNLIFGYPEFSHFSAMC